MPAGKQDKELRVPVPAAARFGAYDALPSAITVHRTDRDGPCCVYANPVALQQLPAAVLASPAGIAAPHRAPLADWYGDPSLDPQRSAAAALAGGMVMHWPDLLQHQAPGRYLVAVPDTPVAWFEAAVSVLDDGLQLVAWADMKSAVGAVSSLTIAWEETAAVSALLETSIEAMPDRFVVARVTRGLDAELLAAHVEHANIAAQASSVDVGLLGGGDLVGCDVREVPGLGGEELWAALRAVAEFGPPTSCRLERVDAQGELEQAEDILVSLVGEDHLVLASRDVTAAVRSEQILAQAWEETSRVRAVLQSALDSIRERFVVLSGSAGPDGVTGLRVETLNAAAAEAAGSGVDDLTGSSLMQVYGPAAAGRLSTEVDACLRNQSPRRWCERQVAADGSWLADVEHVLSPVGQEQLVVTSRDVSDLARREQEMQTRTDQATYAATHDPLTGLANRALLLADLEDALAETGHRRSVLLFADLDRFKPINDTHGHAVGDQVLVAVAHRLRQVSRAGDTVCRLGGDEFVLLLRGLGEGWDETAFLARAGRAIAAPVTSEGGAPGGSGAVSVGASFGVYYLDDGVAADAEEALRIADVRMYEQKANRQR